MFADPNLIGKLASNPKTSKHFADPSFVQQLRAIQQNPRLAEGYVSAAPARIRLSLE
jgi:stress-induced-phosphoprotein 1